ncbi:MAG TPA: hypothetical protein PLP72_23720, partial [Leptospiraceae bacterium]|nr:hypothetical protein [Leptospiraceae bacterium]
MESAILSNPKFIYKEGKPVEVILDIETYTKILDILERKDKKKKQIIVEMNGATLIRNSEAKTGKDIAKFAGIWKERNEIKNSLDYARALRKKAHQRPSIQ